MESLTETRLDPLYVQIWLTKGKQNEATDRNQIGATLCKIWFTKEKQRLEPLTETRWEPFYVKSGLLNVNKTLIINFIKQMFLIWSWHKNELLRLHTATLVIVQIRILTIIVRLV